MTAITERLSAALAGRYRIERHLGEGGMASVYLAEDLKHDRKVAVKVLKPELAAVLGAERFIVEIKTTASLQHPHILPLFDSGTADGFLFYVMPFIKGETLRDKLNRETQLGVDEAVRIAREVADALDYAHRNGVIHRDIKPENILLHDGRPMVADFGIALALSAAAGGRMTETGLSLGTPHYMSPEQATAEKEISARSDVYSLASVLYEMLAGEPPHLGGSAQQIIMKIITDRARPLTDLRKSVPRHVAAAVSKALEKLPADRFETAKAFADALGNPSFTVSGTAAEPVVASARRQPVAVLAVAALVLTSLAGGWAIGRKTTPWSEAESVQFVIELPDSVTSVNRCCGPAQVLSPNGGTLVFVGMKGSGGALYRRQMDQLDATLIPGTEEATSPSFSPRGDWLMFEQGGRLNKVPMTGGPVVPIASTGQIQGATWADNDTIVYSIAETARLWKVAASGGTSQSVPVVDTLARYVYPSALPGGRYVLVAIRTAASLEESRIGVIDVTTGEVDTLAVGARALYANGSLFVGTADNSLLLQPVDVAKRTTDGQALVLLTDVAINGNTNPEFSVSPNGWLAYEISRGDDMEQLRIVDGQGSRVLRLPGRATGDVEDPSISPDGSRILLRLRGTTVQGDLWMFDSRQGTVTRFTVSGARYPAWSRDGKRVAYSTLGSESLPPGIYVQSVEQNEAPQLVLRGNNLFPGSWTADGRSVLFSANVSGVGNFLHDIGLISVGDTSPRWILNTQFSERQPQVSPDGRLLAYTSNRSGSAEVYVQSLGGAGVAVQVSDAGGHSPRWSRDGKTLFYFNQVTIVAASLTGEPAVSVASRRVVSSGIATDVNGTNSNWDVFPDGTLLVIDQGGGAAGRRVALIQNWPALARSLGAKQ